MRADGALAISRTRLDAELVRRGLARSRQHAVELVESGAVRVAGLRAEKAATLVDGGTSLTVVDSGERWVSRAAAKLLGALETFPGIAIVGRRALDAGASTGGFTQVLLARGAAHVVAVDVGYGQLAWSLRTDERVTVHERTNVRDLTPEAIGGPVDLVVADLSFISLRLVLPALARCAPGPSVDFALMVKPQFEAGREQVGSGGVVRDLGVRADAVLAVAGAADPLGLRTAGVCASPLPGPAGNVEFFLWLRRDCATPLTGAERDSAVRAAVESAP